MEAAVNRIETEDRNDLTDIRKIDDEKVKGNAPVQTCLEMALEGVMTPLPGVNCIHSLTSSTSTTSTTPKTSTTSKRSTTTSKTTSTLGDNLLDVRNAFDKKSEAELVSYDVDLEDDKEEEVQDESSGRLLEVEDYPIVGRDFDLATKLIRLNPRQIDDY